MGRLKNCMPGLVVDVAARCNADAAHLRRQCIRQVVAVKVKGRDYVELIGSREDLLQGYVSDRVLDQDPTRGQRPGLFLVGSVCTFFSLCPFPLIPGIGFVAILLFGEFVAPVTEGPFRKLHDIALVDKGDALASVGNGVFDRGAYQSLGTFLGHRLQADTRRFRKTDLVIALREVLLEQVQELRRVFRSPLKLDTAINVFGIFPEDHHIDIFRMANR